MASARFMRKLRLLTRIYDVPLVFDEVQTGWGMTGPSLGARAVRFAVSAGRGHLGQEGSERRAVRQRRTGHLFSGREEVQHDVGRRLGRHGAAPRRAGQAGPRSGAAHRRTGESRTRDAGARAPRDSEERARRRRHARLRRHARRLVRGAARARLPARSGAAAGRRAQPALLSPLRHRAVRTRRSPGHPAPGCRGHRRRPSDFGHSAGSRRSASARWRSRSTRSTWWISRRPHSRPTSSRSWRWSRSATARLRILPTRSVPGRRPLLQFPLEMLEATMASPGALGIALRDRVSGRYVAYALGSALENHDEEGVASDPRFGENNTFYLQAMATLPAAQNDVELENHLLDLVRERAIAAGFAFLSTLIEDRLRETGPAWFQNSEGARTDRRLPAQRRLFRLPSSRAATGDRAGPQPDSRRLSRKAAGAPAADVDSAALHSTSM